MGASRFQWTAARSLKPNLSAPWALLRKPVSCTNDLHDAPGREPDSLLGAAVPINHSAQSPGPRPYSADGGRCQAAAGRKVDDALHLGCARSPASLVGNHIGSNLRAAHQFRCCAATEIA